VSAADMSINLRRGRVHMARNVGDPADVAPVYQEMEGTNRQSDGTDHGYSPRDEGTVAWGERRGK
jgi:hypothetical protein